MASSRTKFIPANAINVVVTVNQTILTNTRKRLETRVDLPDLYTRAALVVEENSILPVTDTLEDVGTV